MIDFGKCITTAAVKRLPHEEQQEYHKKHAHIAPGIVSGPSKPSPASDVYSFGRMASIFAKKYESIVLNYKSVLGNKCTSFNPNARAHLNDIIRQLGAVTKLLWTVGNCWLKFISMTFIFFGKKNIHKRKYFIALKYH